METNLISLIISVVALIIVILAILTYLMQKYRESIKKTNYNIEKREAELNLLRQDYESKIYQLTDRLLQAENRWKDLNHLLISSQRTMPEKITDKNDVQLSNYLKNIGLKKEELEVEKDLVFMLTPFHKDMHSAYDIVSDVCKEIGMRCFRGDEEYVAGDLLPHILRLLVKARFIIANIDGRNPNVFYELGIAHAIDKPTLIIAKSLTDVPFDVKYKQIILYNNLDDLRNKIEKTLAKILVKG